MNIEEIKLGEAGNLIYRRIIRSKKIRDPSDHKPSEMYLLQFHELSNCARLILERCRDHLGSCRHVVVHEDNKRVLCTQ